MTHLSHQTPVKAGSKMTYDEVQQIQTMVASGMSHSQIADALGRGKATIARWATRVGAESQCRYRSWTEDDVLTVRGLLAAGKPYSLIGKVLVRTPKSVEMYVRSHRAAFCASEPTPPEEPAPMQIQPERSATLRDHAPSSDLYHQWLSAMGRGARPSLVRMGQSQAR